MATTGVSLSPEILYMVAEVLLVEAKGKTYSGSRRMAWSTLLNLRLASKEFAGIAIIKRALFENIEFQATQESLDRLKKTDIASLAPFVKGVRFFPSCYETPTYEDFKKLFSSFKQNRQKADKRNSKNNVQHLRDYVNEHWDYWIESFCMPDERVQTELILKGHAAWAVADNDLMNDNAFRDVWSECFHDLRGLTSISLCSALLRHPLNPSWVHGASGISCVCCVDALDMLNSKFGSGGLCLISTVVQCILAASPRIQELSIDWEILITLVDAWETRAWTDLSLAHLSKLTIRTAVNHPETEVHCDIESEGNWLQGILSLLEKTQATLQQLKLFGYLSGPLIDWPSMDAFAFPRLYQIKIGGFVIDTQLFADDISRTYSLETIVVSFCDRDVESEDLWKVGFDALRNHQPQLKHVHFEVMDTGEGVRNPWGVMIKEDDFKSQIPQEPEHDAEDECEPAEQDLKWYITKQGKWTKALAEFYNPDESYN